MPSWGTLLVLTVVAVMMVAIGFGVSRWADDMAGQILDATLTGTWGMSSSGTVTPAFLAAQARWGWYRRASNTGWVAIGAGVLTGGTVGVFTLARLLRPTPAHGSGDFEGAR